MPCCALIAALLAQLGMALAAVRAKLFPAARTQIPVRREWKARLSHPLVIATLGVELALLGAFAEFGSHVLAPVPRAICVFHPNAMRTNGIRSSTRFDHDQFPITPGLK